jgi:hypothetical protein
VILDELAVKFSLLLGPKHLHRQRAFAQQLETSGQAGESVASALDGVSWRISAVRFPSACCANLSQTWARTTSKILFQGLAVSGVRCISTPRRDADTLLVPRLSPSGMRQTRVGLIYSNSPRTFLVLAQTGDCQLEKKLRSTVAKPKRAPRRGYQGRSLSTPSTAEERGVHLRQVSSPQAGNFG